MTSPDPVDRLRDAINSHDPRRVADCFTADYRSEVPHRPAESFVGSGHVGENWTAIFTRLPDLHARVLRRAVAGPTSGRSGRWPPRTRRTRPCSSAASSS